MYVRRMIEAKALLLPKEALVPRNNAARAEAAVKVYQLFLLRTLLPLLVLKNLFTTTITANNVLCVVQSSRKITVCIPSY